MAYIQPTPATFKARFPQFIPVNDALVQLVLDEAIGKVGESWLERDRVPAQLYLTAHLLTLEGEPDRAMGKAGNIALTGPMKSRKVGDVEVTYAGVSGSGSSATGVDAIYGGTTYGQQFLALMRMNFAGPMVV